MCDDWTRGILITKWFVDMIADVQIYLPTFGTYFREVLERMQEGLVSDKYIMWIWISYNKKSCGYGSLAEVSMGLHLVYYMGSLIRPLCSLVARIIWDNCVNDYKLVFACTQ